MEEVGWLVVAENTATATVRRGGKQEIRAATATSLKTTSRILPLFSGLESTAGDTHRSTSHDERRTRENKR